MSDEGPVLVRVEDGIQTITFNRPQVHNALDTASRRALAEAVRRAHADPEVRVLVLAANGPSFSAGHDLREVVEHEPVAEVLHEIDDSVIADLAALPKPTVAAIHGHTIGRGLMLALACDIRIGADDLRASLPEVRLGLFPALGGSYLLTRAVGHAHASRIALTGEPVGGEEALRIGLVNELVARDALPDRTLALAQTLSANAPLAMRFAKRSIDRAARDDLASAVEHETLRSFVLEASADWVEGKAAAAQRRPPRFGGR